MKEVQKSTISDNRKNYSRLFQDYKKIDSFKNIRKRIGKNKYKRSIQVFLVILSLDIISYLIGLFCFFKSHSTAVIIYWGILVLITIFFLLKNIDKLESYRNEMIGIRDNELYELLRNNNINLQNITNAIEYFKLELEPINKMYKEYPILNSISSFWSNLFFLILGIISSSLIEINLNQNGIEVYAIAIAVLVFILFVIGIIKVYIYFDRKDKYADQTRKLIIDLKRIVLLNKST